MPNAAVENDGTFNLGYSYDSPYGVLWASSTILPFLQVTGSYVSINGVAAFTTDPGPDGGRYGRYKDKVFDAKLRLLEERDWWPAVAVGATDLLGTELFKGQYVVASKTFGPQKNLEVSVGYARSRPDGLFAGARWEPRSTPNWAVVAEYDAIDYSKDFAASQTAAGQRKKGPVVGLEYRWGWLGAQIARHRDRLVADLALILIVIAGGQFVGVFQQPARTIRKPELDPRLEQQRGE